MTRNERGPALLAELTARLKQLPFVLSPAREARDLVLQVLYEGEGEPVGVSPHPADWDIDPNSREILEDWVDRREKGEPLAYILGWQPFLDLRLRVDRRVLVPRPETEELAERVLEDLKPAPDWVLELGTGSGCLGLALIQAWPRATLFAGDYSAEALQVARFNAELHGLLERCRLFQGDLLECWKVWPPGEGVLVANLPYVDPEDAENGRLSPEVRAHEPEHSLFPPKGEGVDQLFRRLFLGLERMGLPKQMWLEIGDNQGKRLGKAFSQVFPEKSLHIIRDHAHRTRFLHWA